jgi:hypothetical protein
MLKEPKTPIKKEPEAPMKKKYEKPKATVIKLQIEERLFARSDHCCRHG